MIQSLIIICLLSFFATAALSAPVTIDDPPYQERCGLSANFTQFEVQLLDFYESRAVDRVEPLLESIALLRRSVLDHQRRLVKGPPTPRSFYSSLMWQVSKSGCKTARRYLELNAAELTAFQRGLGDLHPDMHQELVDSIKQLEVNRRSAYIKLDTLGDRIDQYSAQRSKKARSEIIRLFHEVISEWREFGNEVNSVILDYVSRKYTVREELSARGQLVVESHIANAHELYLFLGQQLINFETTT